MPNIDFSIPSCDSAEFHVHIAKIESSYHVFFTDEWSCVQRVRQAGVKWDLEGESWELCT